MGNTDIECGFRVSRRAFLRKQRVQITATGGFNIPGGKKSATVTYCPSHSPARYQASADTGKTESASVTLFTKDQHIPPLA